jgi:hypothetical protein
MSWSALNFKSPAGDAVAVDTASATGISTYVVHPWVLGVGEGERLYQYLSFPNAVKSLLDQVDLSGASAALGVGVCAANYGDFASQLGAFNAVFPMKALLQMQRRALSMAEIENSKLVLNETPGNVLAIDHKTNVFPVMTTLQETAQAETAMARAEAFKASDPAVNLNDFKARKLAHDAAVASALAEAKAVLSGGSGWSFYAQGDIGGALQVGHPGHEYTLTVIVLMLGSVADLALLKEVLA